MPTRLRKTAERPPNAAGSTFFPHLYRQTYWGAGSFDGELITAEIIDNRNRFATEYRLARRVFVSTGNVIRNNGVLDHLEAYQTREKAVVVICSNYGVEPPAHLGMVSIDPLYVTSATTFCRTFDNIRAARLALRDVEEKR